MGKTTVIRTFQTRLRGDFPALDDGARRYGLAQRATYARARKTGKTFDAFKTEICREFDLPARVFNAIATDLRGMVSSKREKAAHDLADVEDKIRQAQKFVAKVMQRRLDGKAVTRKMARRRDTARQKIQRLTAKSERLQKTIDADYPAICFGGRRLFNAQHHLADNKLSTHSEWLERWRARRADQIQINGSDDEVSGNKTCRATANADGTVDLMVALNAGRGTEKLTLRGIRLSHGHDNWLRAIEMANREAERSRAWQTENACMMDKIRARHAEARTDVLSAKLDAFKKARAKLRRKQEKLGHAISYRFKRDGRSWRVFVTISEPVAQVEANWLYGGIGVDVNADHLAIAEADAHGTLTRPWRIDTHVAGLTSGQRRDIYRKAALALVLRAQSLGVPIAIEKLDFVFKKRRLRELGDARRARMLSSFGYRFFREALMAAAKRHGVAVVTVNPAFTSVLGATCHAVPNGISVHLAAAMTVVRRAMKIDEVVSSDISVPVVGETVQLDVSSAIPTGRLRCKADIGKTVEQLKTVASLLKAALRERLGQRPSGALRRRQKQGISDALPDFAYPSTG